MTKTYEIPDGKTIIADVDEKHHTATISVYALDDLVEAVNKTAIDKWIPVSERLPEEGGKYICWFKEQKRDIVTMVAWQPKLRSWNLTGNMAHWKVFAWMPLPLPLLFNAESEDK